MARLLVSVRSADEARAAVAGGAALIDVKEPDRGALGRADASVWAAVRAAVPPQVPLSVALGELDEWVREGGAREPEITGLEGVTFGKLGLAAAGPDWVESWAGVRRRFGAGLSWVAVAYADWSDAAAPSPDEVLDAAMAAGECAGVLVDTWDKSRGCPIDLSWGGWFDRARRGGRMTALAGRLDADAIDRLAPLRPDVVAVRGAACRGGDRRAAVDPGRVAALALAAARV